MERLKEYIPKNKLEKKVKEILLNQGYENLENLFKEVLYCGCKEGVIPELIYYDDTTKFYENYKHQINELLQQLYETGCLDSLSDLEDFDKSDMLVLEIHNQNLLAWLSFEETTRNIMYNLDMEV